ncbi:hypothetical protein M514_06802 [Trichuris suis]|uniref:Protein kinase domain-containing protein n=1 Tax=Trichuris suis TaxID=68888 RepID=A0A085NB53_9BILA|nr:hypothetical protein M513_06802 [Trichuris suis]KFD66699.1 hypothetical protein M514_06802 [Trichuris suis]KHJ41666.1 hypothetical protein D918_08196 [Trichuris suis]
MGRIGGQQAAELFKPGDTVEKRWVIQKVLGRGGFGAVYEVQDLETNRMEAMKIELQAQDFRSLKLEVVVLKELNARKARHICDIVGIGKQQSYCYIVMTLVGPSFQSMLQSLRSKFPDGNTRFGLRSAMHLGRCSLEALEDMHKYGYLHRDVKPQNYSIGREPEYRKVFILDFGMSRKYIKADGTQRRPRERANFRGTLFYASVSALLGEDQAPKDDVWSWFFMLLRISLGRVPWRDEVPPRDMPMARQARFYGIVKQKLINNPPLFLQDCPPEYAPILSHLKPLTYSDKPNYELCYLQMSALMKRNNYTEETALDWERGGEHHIATSKAPAHNMMPEQVKGLSAASPSTKNG